MVGTVMKSMGGYMPNKPRRVDDGRVLADPIDWGHGSNGWVQAHTPMSKSPLGLGVTSRRRPSKALYCRT